MLQQGTGDQDVDYHLMTNGLVIFRDRIYVLDDSGIKKNILREFHVKPYSGHITCPSYIRTQLSPLLQEFLPTTNSLSGYAILRARAFVNNCFN